jgi:hypothetical protein
MDKTTALAALALMLGSPALMAQTAATSTIDPNTFIVGHPASPTWKLVRANGEHPAVQVSRRTGVAAPDSNRFIVQPPASVRWTDTPVPVLVARVPG